MLHFSLRRVLFTVFVLIISYSLTQAQLISGETFLQGNYVEVGVSSCGSYGTQNAPPTGYHQRGLGWPGLGFVADQGRDGWTSGSPTYCGDYFIPGSPVEGFGIEFNNIWGLNSNNGSICGENDIPGTLSCYSNDGTTLNTSWNGAVTYGGSTLAINQVTKLKMGDLFFVTEVTICNTSGVTARDIYYMRNVDPDNSVTISGSFVTTNTIVSQPAITGTGTICDALVTATAPASGSTCFIGLGARALNAKVSYGGFFSDRPSYVYNGVAPHVLGGTHIGDEAISIAFHWDSLVVGQCVKASFAYILDAADLDTAINSTASFNILSDERSLFYTAIDSGCTINSVLSDTLCPGDTTLLEVVGNAGYTWNWSPSTYLDTNAGMLVLVKPLSSITYTVTGVHSSCDTERMTINIIIDSTHIETYPDTLLCLGLSTPIYVVGPDTVYWTPSTGLSDVRSHHPLVSATAPTTYYVHSGCALDSVVVDIDSFQFSVDIIQDSLIGCQGDSFPIDVTISPSSGYIKNWLPPDHLIFGSDSLHNLYVSPADTLPLIFEAIHDGGSCIERDTAYVLSAFMPEIISFWVEGVAYCVGDTVQLHTQIGSGTALWSPDPGFLSPLTSNDPLVIITGTTTLHLTALNGICQIDTSITISIDSNVQIEAEAIGTLCAGTPIQLLGTAFIDGIALSGTGTSAGSGTAAGSGTSIFWTPAGRLSDDSIYNPITPPFSEDTFFVFNLNIHGCSFKDTAFIHIDTYVFAVDIVEDTVQGCIGDTLALTANLLPPDSLSIDWSASAAFLFPTDSLHPLYLAQGYNETIILTANHQAGCIHADSVYVLSDLPHSMVLTESGTAFCPGDSIQLVASGSGSILWWPTTYFGSDSSDPEPYVAVYDTITYHLTSTYRSCTVERSILISPPATVELETFTGGTLCIGSSIQLNATATVNGVPMTGTGAYAWTGIYGAGSGTAIYWTDSTGMTNDSTYNPWSPVLYDDSFFVFHVNLNNCHYEDTLFVVLDTFNFDVDIVPDTARACLGDSIPLTVNIVPTSVFDVGWLSYAHLDVSTDTLHPVYEAQGINEKLYVEVVHPGGCIRGDSVQIISESLFVTLSASGTAFCPGDTIQLASETGSGSSIWTSSGAAVWMSDSTAEDPYILFNGPTSYFLHSEYGSCVVDTGITLDFDNDVIIKAWDFSICNATAINVTGEAYIDGIPLTGTGSAAGYGIPSAGSGTYIYWTEAGVLSDDSIYNPFTFTISSDTFFVFHLSVHGCHYQDTAFIDLTDTAFSQIIDTTICFGSIPGITNDTVIFDTLRTAGACDSLYRQFNVHVLPASLFDSSVVQLCYGELYLGSAQYQDSIWLISIPFSGSSCDSITHVHLISVSDSAVLLIQDTIIAYNGLYAGINYTVSTTLSDTITGLYACDSIIEILNIIVLPLAMGSLDTSLCYGGIYDGISYFTSTSYTDTLTNSSGLDSFLLSINITVLPEDSLYSLDTTICFNGVYHDIIYTADAILDSVILNQNGCDSIHLVTNIQVDSSTLLVNAGPDTLISAGETVVLFTLCDPIGSYTYHWSPASGLSDPNIADPVFSGTDSLNVFVVEVSRGNCRFFDTVILRVQSFPLLPMELLQLRADPINNEFIRISWQTATEINSKQFDILRSLDAEAFEKIGDCPAATYSNDIREYQHDDWQAEKNVLYYYRLNQIDQDGSGQLSYIVNARLYGNGLSLVSSYPNPANEQLIVQLTADWDQLLQLRLVNSIGQTVYKTDANIKEGDNRFLITTSLYAAGLYQLIIESSDFNAVEKVEIFH